MDNLLFREARPSDLTPLDQLEKASFESDRLSRRRLKHWIEAENRVLLVAEQEGRLLGYVLALLHRGTRLARLYSLAIDPAARGQGLAQRLVLQAETDCAELGRFYMRLEVAKNNHSAIKLYKHLGYSIFGIYEDYYEDHQDALRMQKRIRHVSENLLSQKVPWYQQTTDFSCGPAALMMAMSSLDPDIRPNQHLELDLWREATTIFMTSGHGGCHPLGLALAAQRRGFQAEAWINQTNTLFVDGVRSPRKREVMTLVDQQFREQCAAAKIPVRPADFTQDDISRWLASDCAVITLISTFRLDGRKAPHWVAVTAIDDLCLYVHDPDPTEGEQTAIDCQYLPIARQDFAKMSSFGQYRLRTAVVLRRQTEKQSRVTTANE